MQVISYILVYLFDAIAYIGTLCFLLSFGLVVVLLLGRRSINKYDAKTKTINDDFSVENGYGYDYALVFKVYSDEEIEDLNDFQRMYTMKNIIDRCTIAKIDFVLFYSCQRDEIYMKLRIGPDRLKEEADLREYVLKLNHLNLSNAAKAGGEIDKETGLQKWLPIEVSYDKYLSQYDPFEYIYAKYKNIDKLQLIYEQYPLKDKDVKIIRHPFRPVDRIKLLLSILEANTNDVKPGCGLNMSKLMRDKVILAHFPLHDYKELKELQILWLKVLPYRTEPPLDKVKDYFGERIGLYFVFLAFYINKMWIAGIMGGLAFAYGVYEKKSESLLKPIVAGYMILWSTVFIELWKREQSTVGMKWGVVASISVVSLLFSKLVD
eukprot:gene14298-19179_t